ncbi:hypothetical protein R80B4_00656 [Fibrobacteres bacterium R8-0-B4]
MQDGADVVGDWLLYSMSRGGDTLYANDNPDEIQILSLMSSGGVVTFAFEKMGDIWIEGSETGSTWYVIGSTLYTRDRGEEIGLQYLVSGNTLTFKFCYVEEDPDYDKDASECMVLKYKKVNIDEERGRLGTVYAIDSRLYASELSDDLLWYLQSDEDVYIDFDYRGVYGPGLDRYVDYLGSMTYYTLGDNRLFFVSRVCYWDDDDDEQCTVSDPVELPYRITGGGRNAKLSIDGDTWLPADYDDYKDSHDNFWSPAAKSRQSERPTALNSGKGKNFLSPFAQLPALKNKR